jgi:holo-[acyl-carrier protein] synthase
MATVGIGIDIVEIERIERALRRYPRLTARLFTEGEIAYCGERRRPGRHLAARFAAKEATVKALGLTGGHPLTEIEVEAGAPPAIRLHRDLAERAADEGLRLSLSLTHERGVAAAIVLVEE